MTIIGIELKSRSAIPESIQLKGMATIRRAVINITSRMGTLWGRMHYTDPIPMLPCYLGNGTQVHSAGLSSPLPVIDQAGGGVLTPLSLNNQLLQGTTDASASTPTQILQDYKPPIEFQTMWLIAYSEGNPNTTSRIVVKAKLANSNLFTITDDTVNGNSLIHIPIPGGLNEYSIWFGNPDTPQSGHETIHWQLYGG